MTGPRLGAFMLAALICAVIALPPCLDADPNQQALRAAFSPPGSAFLLGADQFGRSILARLLEGGRYSLGLSLSVIGLCMLTGALLASLAAWLGRGWELATTAAADAIYATPGLLLVLVVAGLFGGSLTVLVLALWLASWPEYYRLARGMVRRVLASDHVIQSRMMGVRLLPVLRYQVAPEFLPYITGIGCLAIGRTILAIASLGFLGIGIAPPQAEWGAMINGLLPYLDKAPAQLAAPVLAVIWSVTSCLLIGQAFAARLKKYDALHP